MSWRDDNEEFFSQLEKDAVPASRKAPCELCTRVCRRCLIPVHQHTQAGLTECAWRGHACTVCGHPPHPDNAPDRCMRYTSPDDTPEDRGRRLMSSSHRDAAGPFYTYRHCSRRHGRPEDNPAPVIYEIASATPRARKHVQTITRPESANA
jgi:hypothetical protein